MGRAGETVPGADLLAGVATVEAVTESGSLFGGDFSAVLDGEIGEAFAGIQVAGAFQCSCRAGIQATATTAATVLLRCVVLVRFEGGDDFSQEEERAFSGNNQVCVLPDPSQSVTSACSVPALDAGSQKNCPLRSIPFPSVSMRSRAGRGNRAVHSSLNISLTTRW